MKLMVLDKIKHAIYDTRIYNKRNLPILKSEINDLTLKEHFILSGVRRITLIILSMNLIIPPPKSLVI